MPGKPVAPPSGRLLSAAQRGSSAYYQRLMQVTVRNTYYPAPHESNDLRAAPTVTTAALMRSLGLLFRDEPAGFSILYDANREEELLGYLRRNATNGQYWSRLSFQLQLVNPYFVNFSRIPTNLDPTEKNFYFSNELAHRRNTVVFLNKHRYVTSAETVKTVPVQFPVYVRPGVAEVRVLDIAGNVVLCQPRCVPAGLAEIMVPSTITCRDVKNFFAAGSDKCREKWVCRSTLYLDFSSLPEGLYVVQEVTRLNKVISERRVLFTATGQYCFVDLLFAEPEPDHGGVYPVRDLSATSGTVVPVQYELSFKRRTTYWRYYVVLPQKREARGLRIATEPPDAWTFCGPYKVIVGQATPAFMFVSESPLPLTRQPPARFILQSSDGTLMESMPVASVQQVLPEADSGPGGDPPRYGPRFRDYSDIYVNV